MSQLKHATGLFLVLLLLSCSQSPSDKIIGKWVEITEQPNTIEFYPDGRLLISGRSQVNGNWHFMSENKMKMEIKLSGKKMTQELEVKFVDNKIFVTNAKGETVESVRID